MRSKKWLGTAALTLAVAFTASACGGGNSSATTSPSASGTQQGNTVGSQTATAKPAPVEIVVWDKPTAGDAVGVFREQRWAAFEAKYPHIKVTHVEPTKEKQREQFMTAVAGGQQPDAYKAAFPDMESYIAQGIAADISGLWNGFAGKDKYIPSSLNAATVNNKIYGVPNKMYVTGLMYNKKLLAEAGLDPNQAFKDWNSFAEAAKKLTIPEKNQYGNAILGMDWADWYFEYYVWQAGGDLTEQQKDGTVKLTFTSEPVVQALQYYKDLKWKYQATQKNVVQSLSENQKDFYTGHAATAIGASDAFGGMVSKGMNIADIGFVKLPVGPSGKSPSQVGGDYWIFNPKASPEKQQAAFTYATFMTSKEHYEAEYQFYKENGLFPNMLTIRSDVDLTKYVEGLPADLTKGVQDAAANPRLEYFLKSRLTPYIVKPIQKILLDANADPLTELKAAQDLAQKEVADKYNAEIKK